MGISNDDIGNLFKPFSKLQYTEKLNEHGTGLGLMICKKIVEAHGGSIGVKSKLNQGAVFYFDIQAE